MKNFKSYPLSNYLAHLEEESSDAIFSRGLDQRIISWNNGAVRMFGYTKEEVIGRISTEIGYFKATPEFINGIENKLLENGFWESEINYFHKNGHKIIGAVTANEIRNEDGEVISFLFVIKDITKLKQLENELKEANEALEAKVFIRTKELNAAKNLYQNIFENSPMPMWIFELNTYKFLDVNDTAIKEYGYSKEEFLSMTLKDIRPADEIDLFLNNTELINTNKEIYHCKIWKHQKKNGEIIDVEITNHPIKYKGFEAKLVLANNVTKRVEIERKIESNEKRFRALIENSNDGITLMDENAAVIYRSPSTERITGWSEAEMKGVNATTHVHPDDLIVIQQIIPVLLENPGKLHPIAFRNKHKDGYFRWLEGTIVNMLEDENVNAVVINFKDVTDRIEAEEKLRQSEFQLRYSLDNMIEGVQIIDNNWRYTYVNDSLVKDSKYSREELLGFTMMEKYPGIETTAMFAKLKECMEKKQKGFIENEFIFPDGSKEYFELSIQPIPVGIFILSLNITDRVKAQQQIIASELRFRTLLENGNDIVSMFDENFKIIYRSPSAYKVMGWPDAEMMGETGDGNIHPDDKGTATLQIKFIMENPDVAIDVSLRMKHQQGHYLWVEGKLINLLNNKNIGAIVFNFRDVTDRKIAVDELYNSEKQFRSLVERISDAFVTLDNDLRFTYANKVAESMFEVPEGNLIGKKMYEEFSVGKGGAIYKAVLKALRTKKPQRFDSYSDVFKKWITGSIYPSDTGLTCFFRDNTEVRKLALDLQEQQHREQAKLISAALDAQEKERNAIGIELHDNVNQILVGTTMFLSMLKKKPIKDDVLIEECIDNIKSAINENRKIAHVLVGPDLENKHIGDQIISLCESMLESNGIQALTHFEDYDYTLIPKEKKVALYRIVQELFTNIIKYSEATEVNIYLVTTDEMVLRMRVSDNGKGMDKKKVTSGIGLRNIKSRLLVFDGEMKVETAPGKGFALEVEMPLG